MVKVSYNLGQLTEMMYKVCPGLKYISFYHSDHYIEWFGNHFSIKIFFRDRLAPSITILMTYNKFQRALTRTPLPLSEKGCYVYLNELFDYLSKFSLAEFKSEFGESPGDKEFLRVFSSRLK